jgi:hypothetical protein
MPPACDLRKWRWFVAGFEMHPLSPDSRCTARPTVLLSNALGRFPLRSQRKIHRTLHQYGLWPNEGAAPAWIRDREICTAISRSAASWVISIGSASCCMQIESLLPRLKAAFLSCDSKSCRTGVRFVFTREASFQYKFLRLPCSYFLEPGGK